MVYTILTALYQLLCVKERGHAMRTSQNGIDLIKQFEGCRLSAYQCAAGVWTIGYGHTAGVRKGQIITQVQAESFLKDDLYKFEQKVMKYDSKYHWNQNEFDALVSFAFNIGNIDQLTANGTRDIKIISEKMLQYNKASGRILDGLTKRRKEEQALLLKPVQQNIQAASAEAAQESPEHIQLNYQLGKQYTVCVDGLRIRTKKSFQSTLMLPNAEIIGTIRNGTKVKNHATARVGDQIWMYIGTDGKGREQWVCADIGAKAYIQ